MEIPDSLSHCYARTLRVENDGGSCSSFVMNYAGHQWLVTAKHVVHDVETNTDKPFEVFDQYGVRHSDSELEMLYMTNRLFADVTVFRLWKEYVNLGPPLEPYGADDVGATQDVYFLGFPDLGNPDHYGLKYASPLTPFIKRAIVSGEAKHRNGLTKKIWLLDGMGHHGFSGGPVIIYEPNSKSYRILGVVSGYTPANVRVLPGELPADPNQMGAGPPPLPDDSFSETNSGIAICFDIEHAIADINEHLRRLSLEQANDIRG
jgi:hypothetical protein